MSRRTVERFYRALSTKDEDAWVSLHAPDAISLVPTQDDPLASSEDRRRFFRTVTADFERLQLDVDNFWAAPEGAAVKWTARGMTRSGQGLQFEGVDVFELAESGRIRTVWSYWDPSGLLNKREARVE